MEAAITVKIMERLLSCTRIAVEPGPELMPTVEPKNGLEAKRCDEAKGLLAKVKAAIAWTSQNESVK